jgi:hypothetical protein
MSGDSRKWLIIMLIGAAALIGRAAFTTEGMGRAYIHAVQTPNSQVTPYESATYGEYRRAVAANPNQTEYSFSLWRSIGIWLAAFFTLAVFSFLYGDNPIYKIAEAMLIGVSAAYWMVVGFWDVIVPNLIGKISPATVQGWAMPGLSGPEAQRNLWYLVPLCLGIMLLCRLLPVGGWISRWPLSFIIGVFAGLQLIAYLHGDFLAQIRNSILPLVVTDQGAINPWLSLQNIFIVGGVLCCVAYFFFSFEHTGVMGKAATAGIWVLMITFGASFGYTVMGRIALLAIRIEYLLDDWLWLIDPTLKRL